METLSTTVVNVKNETQVDTNPDTLAKAQA